MRTRAQILEDLDNRLVDSYSVETQQRELLCLVLEVLLDIRDETANTATLTDAALRAQLTP